MRRYRAHEDIDGPGQLASRTELALYLAPKHLYLAPKGGQQRQQREQQQRRAAAGPIEQRAGDQRAVPDRRAGRGKQVEAAIGASACEVHDEEDGPRRRAVARPRSDWAPDADA
jgi:hypothetical protein